MFVDSSSSHPISHPTAACALQAVVAAEAGQRKLLVTFWWDGPWSCTVLYCIVLYCTVLYCTVLMRWSMSAQRLWPFTRPCPLELPTNLSDVSTIKVKCPYKGNLSWCLIWFLNVKTLLAAFFHSLSLWLWNLREGSLQALFPTTVCHYSDPAQCCRWCRDKGSWAMVKFCSVGAGDTGTKTSGLRLWLWRHIMGLSGELSIIAGFVGAFGVGVKLEEWQIGTEKIKRE